MTDKICANEGCGNKLPKNRDLYCSNICLREVNRLRAIASRKKEREKNSKNRVPHICERDGCHKHTRILPKGGIVKYCGKECASIVKAARAAARKFTPAVPDYSGMDIDPAIILVKRDDLGTTL